MFAPSLILDLLLVAVAVAAPWWLRFDHAGLRNATSRRGLKSILFLTMAVTFSVAFAIGFVGLAALGAGTFLRLDGLAAMEELLPLWLPLLVVSTVFALRRSAPLGA